MEFFDSHAHYDDEKFDNDRDEIIRLIYDSGVTKFVSAGYDIKSSQKGLELSNNNEFIYTTSGISPNDVKDTIKKTEEEIKLLERIILENKEICIKEEKKNKIIGIGEIGLDYYWNKENKEIQKFAFTEQIKMANRYDLPIVIHTREAVMDTLEILKNNPVSKRGIFHCCPLNIELIKEGLKLGFYISLAGPVTYKSSKNAEEVIKMLPLDRILIETDSPYLSPEPVRGTRNDSRNVKHIAEKVAKIKGVQLEDIAKITYNNTLKVFSINEL